jgi:hypothetical protein
MTQKKYILGWGLPIISFLSIFLIFIWIHYLIKNDFIQECFQTNSIQDTGSPDTSHTVNMPINTTYSCQNVCGPQNRCSITGDQCSTDVDCTGCQPIINIENQKIKEIRGENDAGKLVSLMPSYSTLTTDIGTQSRIYDWNYLKQTPQYNQGVNVWRSHYNVGSQLFNNRYEPNGIQFLPKYPVRYSATGEFNDYGPLASNAYLHS